MILVDEKIDQPWTDSFFTDLPDKTDLFDPDFAELGNVTLPDCLDPSSPGKKS